MGSIESTYGRPAVTVRGAATVREAAFAMAAANIGTLVVEDEAGRPVGLFGERELLRCVVAGVGDPSTVRVLEAMTRAVPIVGPKASAAECSELMRRHGTRHLLVQDGDALLGVVSMRDVIRALLASCEAEVKHLTAYVTGSFE